MASSVDMVLPGLVNTHSHALQRALRGRVEHNNSPNQQGNFWSWRQAMYRDVLRFDLDQIEIIATWCYLEMLKAGIVAVGEFHYLHHDQQGQPYADPCAVSKRLTRAAERIGIRLVLLQTGYARNAFGEPALPEQRRFIFDTPDAFLAFADQVRKEITSPLVHHGLAAHSVRACPREWIEHIADHAQTHKLPLHLHACEQRQEIATCVAEHGLMPIPLLRECGALTPDTTLVHATHIDAEDIALLAESNTLVSICPSTEKNLGDGICPVADLHRAGIRLCIGSDQHTRIDFASELRSLEELERLRLERRHVLTAPGQRLADALIPIATTHGAQSLWGRGGEAPLQNDRIEIRAPIEADLFGPGEGLDAWLVAGNTSQVRNVFVNGQHVVQDGKHPGESQVYDDLRQVFRALKS